MTLTEDSESARRVALADRYHARSGTVVMTGVQALVRVVIDQMRMDRATATVTGAFISGYPGSPMGGFDLELSRQRELLAELGVVHRPALNEELGVMAVAGTQLVSSLPEPSVEGVVGVWYGKAPGVDRAGDALRHANVIGAHPHGGALAICGDDPGCKSSTIPSASEATLAAMRIPVLYPGSPAEVLRFGQAAIAISRTSGMWVALKIVANVADAFATVDLDAYEQTERADRADDMTAAERPTHRPSSMLLPPASLELERTLVGGRLNAAVASARRRKVDSLSGGGEHTKLGVVAAGAVYYELLEALAILGLSEAEARARLRILKPGLVSPLDRDLVRRFAHGLDTIVVLEERGPFLETALRAALYDTQSRPRIVGERDASGGASFPSSGALDADSIAHVLGAGLGPTTSRRRPGLDEASTLVADVAPSRTPFFCSGCPHNTSSVAPEGAVVGAGIGCHGMLAIEGAGFPPVSGLTPMGLEGSQWIGQSPFTHTGHIFQNLGDGTFSHSGSLAIRAAIAAGVNITYKLLYNDAVAMTGGQGVVGQMPVPDLIRWLAAEGVKQVIVTTDEPKRYERMKLPRFARVVDRREIVAAQQELAKVAGVTVLIHDQGCAAEKRRLRKRGQLQSPTRRVVINQRVCEACGDCGRKSGCLSLLAVHTEYGPKTQVQQSSCNQDFSCLEGDCPSFIEVSGAGPSGQRPATQPPADLPQPDLPRIDGVWTLRLIGVGGTGVVTASQVLAMAGHLDGNHTTGLDQTGIAQKGGPVVSDVRLATEQIKRSSRASTGSLDAYIAFDMLGALNPVNLRLATPERTTAIVSLSEIPTGRMIGQPWTKFPAVDDVIRRIDSTTKPGANVYLDAIVLSEQLFGDHMFANSIVLGAAWQRGVIPVSHGALSEAYRLNGVAVAENLTAFEWGRAIVANPDAINQAQQAENGGVFQPSSEAMAIVAGLALKTGSELERLVAVRVDDLIGYQSQAYAERYATRVGEMRETASLYDAPRSDELTAVIARCLHKLMAYKDEYEVARLHLDPVERAKIRAQFGPGARIRYLLHPPLLRALGLKRKLSFGLWFDPALRLLRVLRRVRGTPLDIFRYARVRRRERALPDDYLSAVRTALPHAVSHYDFVLELCKTPELVRGYESIKLQNIEHYHAASRRLLEQILQTTGQTNRRQEHPDEQ